jgi:hypothetical protein
MPHLEDAFFGRTNHADRQFNDNHTLETAYSVVRDRAMEYAESETGLMQKTLFACVRLYDEPFITSYHVPTMVIKDGAPHMLRLPSRMIEPKDEDKDPTFFFALGNPANLAKPMHYVMAELSRESEEITKLDISETSQNGVNGSVDQWVNGLISGYNRLSGTLNRTMGTLTNEFDKFYMTFFKNEYYLSMCVKDDPLVQKLHVSPDGTMAYNTKDRAFIPLF